MRKYVVALALLLVTLAGGVYAAYTPKCADGLLITWTSGAETCASNAVSHTLAGPQHTDTVTATPNLGDLLMGNVSNLWAVFAGSTSATMKCLHQTGTGTASALAVWDGCGNVNAQTGTTYTVLASDNTKLVTHTNASSTAVTLPQAGTAGFAAGFMYFVENRGAGTVTITPTTSTIDGAASLALTQNQGVCIFSDGTNYFTGCRGLGGGSGANSLGTYLVQTATNAPVNAQVLSSLASGCLSVTTGTGVVASSGVACGGGGSISGLTTGTVPKASSSTTVADSEFIEEAAHTYSLYNSTNAETLRIYKTRTDASNYERMQLGWDAGNGIWSIGDFQAGTGVTRNLCFTVGNSPRWCTNTSGHLEPQNTFYDVGTSGAKWRSIYASGGQTGGIVSKNALYTLAADDRTVLCDTTSAGFSLTLPAAASHTGRFYTIKKIVAANTCTIQANGAETIDGANTVALTTQWSGKTIQSNGTSWFIVASF